MPNRLIAVIAVWIGLCLPAQAAGPAGLTDNADPGAVEGRFDPVFVRALDAFARAKAQEEPWGEQARTGG